jgi:hypothetical protein
VYKSKTVSRAEDWRKRENKTKGTGKDRKNDMITRERIDNNRAPRATETSKTSSPNTHPSLTQHARKPICVGTDSRRYTGAVGADGGKEGEERVSEVSNLFRTLQLK